MKIKTMGNRNSLKYCFFAGLMIATSTFAFGQVKTEEQNAMKLHQNKQLILRFFDEVFNRQSLSVIEELYTPDVVDHSAFPDQGPGVEGIRSAIKNFFEYFDELNIKVEEIIAENDKVVTLETWQVVHKSSGKTAEGTVVHIFQIRNGRITDEWSKGWEWLEYL